MKGVTVTARTTSSSTSKGMNARDRKRRQREFLQEWGMKQITVTIPQAREADLKAIAADWVEEHEMARLMSI